jgi:hypothetical protein
MKRRDFIKSLAIGSGAAALAGPVHRLYAAPAEYDGRLLLVLQADGGWDVTSFCDPKMNQPGYPEINQWARTDETRTAGAIDYAPFANNEFLFEKYHNDMLVINGVDAQTNSHTTGVLHNWSGRNSAGYPTLTAMFAAENAPDIPLSYVSHGGFAATGRLIRYSRLDDVYALFDILQPNVNSWDNSNIRRSSHLDRIEAAHQRSMQAQLDSGTITPQQRYNIESYLSARSSAEALRQFTAVLPATPEEFQQPVDLGGDLGVSYLMTQIQLSILAFESGVGCAADLFTGGYDTHSNHDDLHRSLFSHLADAIDFLWTYAEERGVADRLTLVIGSDFGRTPNYNADNGKDHWPIGSFIVMEKNAAWGNRQVGWTDAGHNAYRINPDTLLRDSNNGTIIYPKHVHKALRRHLGLENSGVDSDFLFAGTEDFDFFNPAKTTT